MAGESEKSQEIRLGKVIKKVLAGNRDAMGEFIDLTQARLLKFAFLLTGQSEVAEELCQETYIKAFASISSITEPEKAMSWLYKILKNLSIDRFRLASVKHERTSEDYEYLVDSKASAPDKEKILYVRELVQCLSPEDRTLVLMVHLEEYTYREAGEILGLTEDAVRLRLHRARKLLLEKVRKDETKRPVASSVKRQ